MAFVRYVIGVPSVLRLACLPIYLLIHKIKQATVGIPTNQ